MRSVGSESGYRQLSGRSVVVTRPRAQAQSFIEELEAHGARVILCPTIEITDPESYARLDEAIEHLYGYDWLIFTSSNAVDYFFRRLLQQGHEINEIDELRVCVIGDATAAKLRELQIHVDVVPEEFSGEGVFAALEHYVGGRAALAGLNFLLPRATVARDYLPQTLEEANARVDVVPAYRTVLPQNEDRGRIAALISAGADCVTFTSSSAVKNLARLLDTENLGEILQDAAIACIGDATAKTAAVYGLGVDIQPEASTTSSLAAAIAAYFESATPDSQPS